LTLAHRGTIFVIIDVIDNYHIVKTRLGVWAFGRGVAHAQCDAPIASGPALLTFALRTSPLRTLFGLLLYFTFLTGMKFDDNPS